MKFSKKNYPTGFHQAIHFGVDGDEYLVFFIKTYTAETVPAVQIRRETRSELAKDLLEYRRARRTVPKSSLGISAVYPVGSWRWLAAHCGYVKIFSRGEIKTIGFKSPCVRKILRFVE